MTEPIEQDGEYFYPIEIHLCAEDIQDIVPEMDLESAESFLARNILELKNSLFPYLWIETEKLLRQEGWLIDEE